MLKNLLLLLTVVSLHYVSISQTVTASFTAPDTVCRKQQISITNTSQNNTTSKWFFCKETPSTSITGVNLGSAGMPTRPTVIEIAKEGANYIGFVGNNKPYGDQLVKINFGANLLSVPTATPMGTFGGLLTEPEGIQLFNEGGNWYGIIVSNNPSTYVLARLNFGSSLNNTPTITSFGNLGGLLNGFMTELIIVKTGGQYIGFIGFDNGNMIRIEFGASITNTPTGTPIGNPGGITRVSKMGLIQRNGSWYLFIPNDGYTNGNYFINRLNFGNSLTNTPTTTNLGNPGNLLNRAYDFLPFVDCEGFKGYVFSPGDNSIIEYTFPNDIGSASITGVKLGNIGGLSFPNSFSNVISYNGENYVFVPNVNNNTISRLKLSSNCQSFGVPTSTLTNPPPFSIDSAGTYNVTLVVDENLPSETRTCQEIIVIDSIPKPDASVAAVCLGDTIKLRINNIEPGATYAWTGPGGFTANTANVNIPNATIGKAGQYIVTATGRCGSKKDTVNVVVNTVSVNLGRDTAICQSSSITLNATTASATYLWSTGATSATISVSTVGSYWVRVTVNGCIGRDTIVISQLPRPPSFSIGNDTTYCGAFSRVLSTGNATTTWSTGATGAQITVTQPGMYIATISNSCGPTRDTINIFQTSCVTVTASFTAPDTVCRKQQISITNTSQNNTTSKWFFCKETPSTSITGVNLGSAGMPTRPTVIEIAKEGANYIGFVGNNKPYGDQLVKINFGANLLSVPTATPMGTFGGLLTEPEGIQLFNENGNWYGIVVSNNPSTYVLARLNFGSSLNNTPTITSFGNLGGLLTGFMTELIIVKTGGQYIGFIGFDNGNMIRIQFGASITNTPTGTPIGNPGGITRVSKMGLIQRGGNWYLFVPNDGYTNGNYFINRLNFGNSLTNTPTTTNLGNPGNLLNRAYDFLPFVDCEGFKGYVFSPGDNSIIEYTFPNDVNSSSITGVKLGNIGGLSFPNSFSNVINYNGENYVFVPNVNNNTISRLKLSSNCQSFGVPTSTLTNPPPFSIDSAGTYNVTLVVDENLPSETRTCQEIIVIDSIPKPDASVAAVCLGDTIKLRINNIEPGATYAWTGPGGFTANTANVNIPNATIGKAGQYIVTATGRCGSKKDTVNVVVNTVSINLGRDTAICQTNSLTLNATTASATYLWSTGATSTTISVNQPGTYWVRVTVNGCVGRDTIVVSLLAGPPPFSIGNDTTYCGSFSRVLSTGNATTSWSTGATGAQITVTQPGTYIATISNSCGPTRDTIVISQSQAPAAFTLGRDTSYCGSFSRVLSTGNATTSWSTGATGAQITVTQPGTYIATISNNCGTAKDTIIISQSQAPVVNLGRDTTLCSGNSLTLNATTASATYLWSTGATSPTISVNQAGTYWAQVTVNGCSGRDSIQVSLITTPAKFNLGNDTSYCGNFSRVLSTGNATTSWSTGATGAQISVTQPGTYIATISNSCGSTKDTIIIGQNPIPVVNLGRDTALCSGNSLTLNATTASATYLWSTGATSPTISVNQAGTYWAQVTVNGCSGRDSIRVSLITTPAKFNLGNDTSYCGNFSRVLSTGNATTSWSTGATGAQISVTQPGTYIATISNSCGSTKDTIVIGQNPIPVLNLGRDTALCSGNSLTLNATTASATYLWSTGATSPTISVNQAGTYWAQVTVNGCSDRDTINVTVNNAPSILSLGNDTTYCGNFNRVLSTGNATTTWSTGATGAQISVNQPGTYIATISNNCGTVRDTIILGQDIAPAISLGPDSTICQGSDLTLDATTPGATYQWNTGATTPTILVNQAGSYSVAVQSNSCLVRDTVQVFVQAAPAAFSLGNDTAYCGDFSRVLSTGINSTQWSTGQTAAQVTVSQGGTYTASVSNACGSSSDTIVITQTPVPAVEIERDTVLCAGEQIELKAITTNGVSYLWNDNSTNSTLVISEPGVYYVTVSLNGCSSTDTAFAGECEGDLWIPNAFTPNGDGVNDVFGVYGHQVSDFRMLIFDRWGEKLFESHDISKGWDGTYKGEKVLIDSYVWVIFYQITLNGKLEEKMKKGTVTVLK